MFPSLFRDSSDHHPVGRPARGAGPVCFHPSLGIPLIITDETGTHSHADDTSFHPSLGIPLIITSCGPKPPPGTPPGFPSLFRDSSDHHPGRVCGRLVRLGRGFHTSLGIPLIITTDTSTHVYEPNKSFHPSLGIPLIITPTHLLKINPQIRNFPSLFRDSSDHHADGRSYPPSLRRVSIPL